MSEEQKPDPQLPKRERPSGGVQGQTFGSYKSYWPFILAFTLCILLMGVITNPVILGIGAVSTAVAIIGWGLERR